MIENSISGQSQKGREKKKQVNNVRQVDKGNQNKNKTKKKEKGNKERLKRTIPENLLLSFSERLPVLLIYSIIYFILYYFLHAVKSAQKRKKKLLYIYNSSILSFLSFCFLFIFLTEEFLTLDKMVNIQMETNHSLVVVLKNEHNTYKYLYKF